MMRQYKSKLIFLRLALGLELLMSSIMVSFSYHWNHIFTDQAHLSVWSGIMALGGLWLSTSSMVSIIDILHPYLNLVGDKSFFNRHALVEFFFCGAIWGGIWWESLANLQHHFLDVLAPLNVAFLLLLAFKDSTAKRERVVRRNEAKFSTVVPPDGMAVHDRLRAERLRG